MSAPEAGRVPEPAPVLDHVQLAIPAGGEALARRFYGLLLGLDEKPKPPSLVDRGGVWFGLGDLQLHLGVEAGFRPALKAHPAFRVGDLDRLAENLQADGRPVEWDDALPDERRFYTNDPFGNRLEFMARRQGA